MKNIKLVALDMDGTLLDSNKQLPADFIPWVKAHPHIRTMIASGRQYYTLLKDFEEIKDDLLFIAENGGLVYDKNQVIFCDAMDVDDAKMCLSQIQTMPGVVPVVGGEKSAYIETVEPRIYEYIKAFFVRLETVDCLEKCLNQDRIVKIAVYVDACRAEEVFPTIMNLPGRLKSVLSGKSWIDIANNTVNKGAAVAATLQKLDISPRDAMAFGDYLNDYEMLQVCGESYCMENGHPDVKKVAKYIAESNDNDGVMRVLRQI